MPFGLLKRGGAVVFGIPMSPFTGWQHGSIDASLVSRACSFSRMLSFDMINFTVRKMDPTMTSVAVSNEIIMGPQAELPRGVVKVTDHFFGITSLLNIGNSSASFIVKLYLSVDKEGINIAPVVNDSVSNGSPTFPMKLPMTETIKLTWADSEDSTSGSHLPSELVGIPIGSSTITAVNANKKTKKGCPLSPDLRESFLKCKSDELLKQWEQEGYVPNKCARVNVNFKLVMKAFAAFQKQWDKEREGLNEEVSSYTTQEEVNALVAGEMGKVVASECTNVNDPKNVKNECPLPRKWKDESIFIFTTVINLRPEDFDFNSHLNMNMYTLFIMDAIRLSMHEYLYYVATKRGGPKGSSSLMSPIEITGKVDNSEPNDGDVTTYHVDHLGRFLLANNHRTLISNIIASKNDICPMSLFHDCSISAALQHQPHYAQSDKSPGLTIEEMVKRSRIEYISDVPDIHSRLEVTVFSHHKYVVTENMEDKCGSALTHWQDSILLKFVIRCLPPISAKNKKPSYEPYVSAIGEIEL